MRKLHEKMNSLPQRDFVIAHTCCLVRSFRMLTERDLLPGTFSARILAQKIFEAPFAVLSHGMEADPVLNYGNRTALALWEMSWNEFIRTPSRLTAEAPERGERAKLLAMVSRRGFIDNYSGIRISKGGRRFRISGATLWNLVSETGAVCGQAAMFSEWNFL